MLQAVEALLIEVEKAEWAAAKDKHKPIPPEGSAEHRIRTLERMVSDIIEGNTKRDKQRDYLSKTLNTQIDRINALSDEGY